jgi:hypothetical protein
MFQQEHLLKSMLIQVILVEIVKVETTLHFQDGMIVQTRLSGLLIVLLQIMMFGT